MVNQSRKNINNIPYVFTPGVSKVRSAGCKGPPKANNVARDYVLKDNTNIILVWQLSSVFYFLLKQDNNQGTT